MVSHTKHLSVEDLREVREDLRAQGKRVAQCHGCFDIVHPGHIRYLRFAREKGDVLIVSVSSDAAKEITVTTSIGLAVASRHPDATDLLKRADYALYAAKRAGRDTVHLFPEDADFTSATGTAA